MFWLKLFCSTIGLDDTVVGKNLIFTMIIVNTEYFLFFTNKVEMVSDSICNEYSCDATCICIMPHCFNFISPSVKGSCL